LALVKIAPRKVLNKIPWDFKISARKEGFFDTPFDVGKNFHLLEGTMNTFENLKIKNARYL
jgi:hypothetical protein